MIWQAALFLIVASSLDSFVVGLSYGCAGITLAPIALLVPGIFTATAFFAAVTGGNALKCFVSGAVAQWVGGALLVAMGAHSLEQQSLDLSDNAHPLIRFSFMGLVLLVLRDSRVADIDRSKVIDRRESVVLGAALALDAFGIGLSAALAGFPTLQMTFLIGLLTPLSMLLGTALGRRTKAPRVGMRRLPAWTMIVIGLLRLLQTAGR